MKYKEWLEEWLSDYIKPTAKQKTYTRYAEIIRLHINPKLGEYEIDNLMPIMLQKFITELLRSGNKKTGKGLAPNSVNTIISVLQGSLDFAYNLGIAKESISRKIKRPKVQEKRVSCFTLAEQKKIEKEIITSGKSKLFGILLCMYTGLRIGELLAIEWIDIDFTKCEISVTKSCYDGKDDGGRYCRIADSPKTKNSIRTIPLPRQIIPYLRDLRKKCASKYVINNGAKIISVRSYQKTFETLLKKLRIEHKGFHALRHTFATRALECGMDVKTLSEILGHKSPTIVKVDQVGKKVKIGFKAILLFIIGLVSGYFICLVIGGPLITLLYPGWAQESQVFLPICVASSVFIMVNNILNTIIIRFYKMSFQMIIQGIDLLVYLFCTLVLLKLYFLMGFCVGVLVASIIKTTMLIIILSSKKNKKEKN